MTISRTNEKYIFNSFNDSFVTALLGPRRVGKTTLLERFKQTIQGKKIVSLDMDKLAQRMDIEQQKLQCIIEDSTKQLIGGPEKIWVFIDEAQKCPLLFDQVKILYDRFKDKDAIKIILTGSAHLNLHQFSAESLAGRIHLLNLRGFNLQETTRLFNKEHVIPHISVFDTLLKNTPSEAFELLESYTPNIRPFQRNHEQALEHMLTWGNLPEVLNQPNPDIRIQDLHDYLQTYLETDIRAIDSVGDLKLYQNLMKICAELTGSVRDDKKIIDALNCSRITLQKYRNYLWATLQYTELYPYISSSLKRLTKSPKGYILDNGLISTLTNLYDLETLKKTALLGHRFETWFLGELQTWLDRNVGRHQIDFWRTAWGAEVDFVVSVGTLKGRLVIPIEATLSAQVESKKINNLKGFMLDNPEASFGIICYTGPLSFDAPNRILYLPAWMVG